MIVSNINAVSANEGENDVITILPEEYDNFLKEHNMPVAGDNGFIIPMEIHKPTAGDDGFIIPLENPLPIVKGNVFIGETDDSASGSALTGFIAEISKPDSNATIITTPEELANIKQGNYVLGNDIDLSTYNDGIWTPIEPSGEIVLDGQGHKIFNMCIPESADISYAGLFGRIRKNTTLKNICVTEKAEGICGSSRVGGLIGYIESTDKNTPTIVTIKNCYNSGNVTVQKYGNASGGLIGSVSSEESTNLSVVIEDSYNSGNITNSASGIGIKSSGGLIGSAYASGSYSSNSELSITITNSYNTGNVTSNLAEKPVGGGLIGFVAADNGSSNAVIIRNSFNNGNITSITSDTEYNHGESYSGGLVGYITHGSETFIDITMENSCNSGKIICKSEVAGGLIGYSDNANDKNFILNITIENCYNSGEILNSNSSTISVNYGYSGGLIGAVNNSSYKSADITVNNSYNSGNVADTFYEDCIGGIVGYSTVPITIENSYNSGIITGNSEHNSYIGGLVGSLNNEKITIENSYNSSDITTKGAGLKGYNGGLIGYINSDISSVEAVIKNSSNSGKIRNNSSQDYSGGLIGYAVSETSMIMTIENSCNSGEIISGSDDNTETTKNSNTGGIIGYMEASDIIGAIKNSYNSGEIIIDLGLGYSTSSYNGGLIGFGSNYGNTSDDSTIKIESSYNSGNITSSSASNNTSCYSGGLIGRCSFSDNAIKNSYNSGNIISNYTPSVIGGLIGTSSSNNNTAINKSYFFGLIESEGTNNTANGIMGENYGTLTIQDFNFYFSGDEICKKNLNTSTNVIFDDGAICKKLVMSFNPENSVIKFDYASKEYEVGSITEENNSLSATLTPHLDDKSGLVWESSNPEVIEIIDTDTKDGIFSDTLLCSIKCKSAGTSTITVTYTNGANASCVVTVKEIAYGSVDGDAGVTANDAACLLKKVLDNSFEMPIEKKTNNYIKYADVDGDKKLTAKDAAIILQKTLQNDFIMPVEK